ncbi:MAG: hypothetical protein SWH61_03415 [Thermodesulfobacteriota bacterium]|nr:hypothetical protein [Thermodesulfobacteriota bacterium]
MTLDKQKIIDQVKIMVMAYDMKIMANDINKAYSSLSNELDERDWAKLGFRDVLSMLELVLNINPKSDQAQVAATNILDMIDHGFSRVAYSLSDQPECELFDTMQLISRISKEFSENVKALAEAIETGQWTKDAIKKCKSENRDLMRVCLQVEHHLNCLINGSKAASPGTEAKISGS